MTLLYLSSPSPVSIESLLYLSNPSPVSTEALLYLSSLLKFSDETLLVSAAIVSVSSNAMILGCNTVQKRVKENIESMFMLIPKGGGGGQSEGAGYHNFLKFQ